MEILFVIGQSQYDSTAVFMEEMEKRISGFGHKTFLLDGRDQEEYQRTRLQVAKESFDVIFTINGMLLEEDSELGKELLADQHAIYCTYLMDHPLIHALRLKNKYPKIFVLAPDQNHVRYIDRYLTNIWGTAFLPHAGCAGTVIRPYMEREIDLSFMGSYILPERVRAEFSSYPEEMRQIMENAADLLIQNSELSLEEAVVFVFENYKIQLSEEEIAEILPEFRIVDRYIRSYYRDQVIRTLLDAGICVDVYGDGWEQFHGQNTDCLNVHPAISYMESLDATGNSKISLNIMPWFKDGAHDRVFTAMLCGAVCLTDGSLWLEEQLRETENVYFYSLKGLKYLPAKVRRILADSEAAAQVAGKGKKLAEERHTWAGRAEELVDYLEQLLQIEDGCEGSAFSPEIVQENITLLRLITKALQHLRKQEYLYAMRNTMGIINRFQTLIPLYLQQKDRINSLCPADIIDETSLLMTLQELLEAQQKQDYIYLADILELRIMPSIISMQEVYAQTTECPELPWAGYHLEYTSSGEYTLSVECGEGRKYLHTNGRPYEEGQILANSWFDEEHFDYTVYGLGLGYHIIALLQLDEAIKVRVLEADPHILELARTYGTISSWEESGRLELIADPDFGELVHVAENLREGERFVIHYPSMALLENQHYREQLERYFIEYSSAQTQLYRLKGNFIRNQEYFRHEVTELREQFVGKTVYIIAAGPSLDRNMMDLKQISTEGIILSTGTVFKKLLKAGIQPDYVMITDAGRSTYSQIQGLEETEVPLLYLSTVYHSILAEYPGASYLICQKDFAKSEEYAGEYGYPLYETGGSVTTTALDICISLGCRRIVFVGLDLAYTGNQDHATDTAYQRTGKEGNLSVTDIHGNQVSTAKNLDLYRRWIEKRISRKDAAGIEFIDATEGGARIEGTKLRKLKEVL